MIEHDDGDSRPAAVRGFALSGRRGRRLGLGAAVVVGAVSLAVPVAAGSSGDDDGAEVDQPITGDALDRASTTALEHLGEGRVTGTEVEDEESYYEVEVTLDDGSQVDVQLDENFNVVDSMPDSENDS